MRHKSFAIVLATALLACRFSSALSEHHHPSSAIGAAVDGLRAHGFRGEIHPLGSRHYDAFRVVQNGACNRALFPLVVARPTSTRDVAVAVRAARENYLELSVRSGGHGYTCNNLKNGSIHLDLRRLNKVQLLKGIHSYGHKGYLHARLGPGSKWSRVLSIIKPEEYTMVHGQCTDVGVGGYLLGGGVNVAGSTSKYGLGCENVDEYTVVNADGEIMTVTAEGVTRRDYDGNQISTVPSYGEDDLFFALKGAGSNFGITTEFLYRVHPHPETKPVVLFLFLRNAYDVLKLQRLSDSGHYQIAAYRIQHFRKLRGAADNAINLALETFVRTFKKLRRQSMEPMVAMFTDLRTKGPKTPLAPLLREVNRLGLRNALPHKLSFDRSVTRVLGLAEYDPNWKNYDALYLSEEERERIPKQAYASSTLMSAPTPKIFNDIFKHPIFGLRAPISNTKVEIGCDACNWFFTIWSGVRHPIRFYANDRVPEGTGDTRYAFEFTCSYDQHDRRRAKLCKANVEKIRSHLNTKHLEHGALHHHYYNTPSCHPNADNERPFQERYFGTNYEHLLRIKQRWDPYNVFNHCHSIGSTEEDCCLV